MAFRNASLDGVAAIWGGSCLLVVIVTSIARLRKPRDLNQEASAHHIIWTLALVFGEIQPNWGPGLRWGTALAASVLFLASVLAHELAHSLVARARGIPVCNIPDYCIDEVADHTLAMILALKSSDRIVSRAN